MTDREGLAGRVAVVTGAGRGIGFAYARGLAEDGATVAIADIDRELAETAAQDLRNEGLKVSAFSVDVSDKPSTLRLASEVREQLGAVSVLVNNAAIFHSMRTDSQMTVDIEYWRKVFAVNVEGVLLCTQAIAPMMIEGGWGRVINQTSTSVYLGNGGHYGCSKAAIIPMTQKFARELGPHGITVNAIAPGWIKTDASMSIMQPGREQFWLEESALKRVAEPEDLVGTLRFLASDDASWVTAQTLVVDGGVCRRF